MKCPFCFHEETVVKDSRPSDNNKVVRRRRECVRCKKRYTTHETIYIRDLRVRKRDGHIVPFEREKIIKSANLALRKRDSFLEKKGILRENIEDDINAITWELERSTEGTISSEDIGYRIMSYLQMLDEVAYLRFASVYMNFKDAEDFSKYTTSIKKDN